MANGKQISIQQKRRVYFSFRIVSLLSMVYDVGQSVDVYVCMYLFVFLLRIFNIGKWCQKWHKMRNQNVFIWVWPVPLCKSNRRFLFSGQTILVLISQFCDNLSNGKVIARSQHWPFVIIWDMKSGCLHLIRERERKKNENEQNNVLL